MTDQEFASLKPGDIIHHPAQPGEIWTVVAYHQGHESWLVIKGVIEINHRSKKFWICATLLSEQTLQESVESMGLNYSFLVNPGNWTKKELIQ